MSSTTKSTQLEKTFQYQDSLPSLPVPPLNQSLNNYLRTLEPLLTSEELVRTTKIVREFESGVGKTLQQALEQRATRERNWLEEWWEIVAYHSGRYPIPVNTNIYGALFDNDPVPDCRDQLEAATACTYFNVCYNQLIRSEKLPVERLGNQPLCMNQTSRLFGTCRLPGDPNDSLTFSSDSRHIVVLVAGRAYFVEVIKPNGAVYTPREIYAQLMAVAKLSEKEQDKAEEISLLTGLGRKEWTEARKRLIELGNIETLRKIESSLFTLVLDPSSPSNRNELAYSLLIGNYRDRWFDKSLNVIIFKNGKAGINSDHSFADAIVIVRLMEYNLAQIQKQIGPKTMIRNSPLLNEKLPAPHRLYFKVDEKILGYIIEADKVLKDLAVRVDINVLLFEEYGRDLIKTFKISPDTWVQLALQLAYYRMYGKPTATYETGHTRLFYHGRTETIRSCSSQSHKWTQSMTTSDTAQRRELLQNAAKAHDKYVEMALQGQASDRHLLGLALIAAGIGIPRPEIFTDKAYQINNYFRLSTSNIGVKPTFGGFGPVYEEGYGCCYTIQTDTLRMSIACWKGVSFNRLAEFQEHVKEALRDLRNLFAESSRL